MFEGTKKKKNKKTDKAAEEKKLFEKWQGMYNQTKLTVE
jgi:hypothetical protein